jgi:hypothetical protein
VAGSGREWQIRKRPNPTTSRNAERQKVLPPPASDCHSRHEWLSSPSRIRNNRVFLRESWEWRWQATQIPTHAKIRGWSQEVAGSRSLRPAGTRDKAGMDPLEYAGAAWEWPVCGPAVACFYG